MSLPGPQADARYSPACVTGQAVALLSGATRVTMLMDGARCAIPRDTLVREGVILG